MEKVNRGWFDGSSSYALRMHCIKQSQQIECQGIPRIFLKYV